MKTLDLNAFLQLKGVTLDVRSPAEFAHAHLPGAKSLPLFDNEERAQVGTCYKQEGHFPAVELGLQFVGPKMGPLIDKAKELLEGGSQAKVHCWRGGMRSQSVAQLLELCGISTVTLNGGYKSFRKGMLEQQEKPLQIRLLGGMTGSGKTTILHALAQKGEQVLDLEKLANHRGSAFGKQSTPQPSTEHFENLIGYTLSQLDCSRPIWIEDESRLIGRCKIPSPLFEQMACAPLLLLERPIEERLQILQEEYGDSDPQELIRCTKGISRRLGDERMRQVIDWIETGSYREACLMILQYYDKGYQYNIQQRQQPLQIIAQADLTSEQWADELRKRLKLLSEKAYLEF
jgi:tRNA 2-selenouridine synthase